MPTCNRFRQISRENGLIQLATLNYSKQGSLAGHNYHGYSLPRENLREITASSCTDYYNFVWKLSCFVVKPEEVKFLFTLRCQMSHHCNQYELKNCKFQNEVGIDTKVLKQDMMVIQHSSVS